MADAPFTSFGAQILAHAAALPDQRAVVCDGETLTYGELAARARAPAPGGFSRSGWCPAEPGESA